MCFKVFTISTDVIATSVLRTLFNLTVIILPNVSGAAEVVDFSPVASSVLQSVVTVVVDRQPAISDTPPEISNTVTQGSGADTALSLVVERSQEMITNHGSGFVFRTDGYILTAAHVVEDAQAIFVLHNNGNSYPAELILCDSELDVAVLKIEDEEMPTLSFLSQFEAVELGEPVMAMGSPYSFANSVSAGIVSHPSRSLETSSHRSTIPYIQTDIPINPGYSGGPVVNANGDVVGMNARIYSPTGSSIGISLAIPHDVILSRINDLLKQGVHDNPIAGISTTDVTLHEYSRLGLARPVGARVREVAPNSKPALSGLRVDDVIITLEGEVVESNEVFVDLLNQHGNTDPVKITVIRSGSYFSTSISL